MLARESPALSSPRKRGSSLSAALALDQRWTPASAGVTIVSWAGGQRRLSAELYTVYMMASRRYGTLYVGVTNDLARRVQEHRSGVGSTFTRKSGVGRLVW